MSGATRAEAAKAAPPEAHSDQSWPEPGVPSSGAAGQSGMPRDVLTYLWRAAPLGHIRLFAVVLALLPFNYASLELPRLIVNGVSDALSDKVPRLFEMEVALPDWLGGAHLLHFAGYEVTGLELLTGLAATLFALQLIQQEISRVIEMGKARLGERILAGLRRDLFDVIQRLRPEAPMRSRALELGNVLRFEVAAIGPFAGMAFAQPLLSAGLVASATLLIFVQNTWLGLCTLVILALNHLLLGIQRRENDRRLRAYQAESTALGRRIFAGIDRLPLTHGFATSPWERGEVDERLERVTEAGIELKRQTATERTLDLLLSDVPTLVFYFVGGWLTLTGALNIGQLVAVIAAYGQIPDPLNAVSDWDERRVNAQLRYDIARHYLEMQEVWPKESQTPLPATDTPFDGTVKVADLSVTDPAGRPLLDHASFEVPAGTAAALKGPEAGGKHAAARVLGRSITRFTGSVRLGGHDLATAPEALMGAHTAYAGGEPVVLTATLRENMVGALRRRRPQDARGAIDLDALGLKDETALDRRVLDALKRAGLDELVVRLGLERRLDPMADAILCGRIVSLRAAVTDAVAKREDVRGASALVEPFRFAAFNRWMSLAENILFAAPQDTARGAASLLASPGLRPLLEREALAGALSTLGRQVAQQLMELAGGPDALATMDTKGLVRSEEAALIGALLARGADAETPDDQALLITLAGRYCEPRHRLGLVDGAWQARAVSARVRFAGLEQVSGIRLARYQPDEYCPALTVRDNLLFGRIAADHAGAAALVDETVRQCLELDALLAPIERLSLDVEVGESGLPLSAAERGKLTLARCLVSEPDILVIDDALAPLSAAEQSEVLARVLAHRSGRTNIVVLDAAEPLHLFDHVLHLDHGEMERQDAARTPAGRTLS